jgi:hypothetical protein
MESKKKQIQQVLLELIADGQTIDVPVYGISMFPFLMPGILVRVRLVAFADIRKGDVLFFESNGQLILHRVVRKGNDWFQCKGDSLRKHDSVIPSTAQVGVVVAWKRSKTFRSTQLMRFRCYAVIMVALHRVTGYVIWPFALIWNKWNRLKG